MGVARAATALAAIVLGAIPIGRADAGGREPDLRVTSVRFATGGVDDGVIPHGLIERDGSTRLRIVVSVKNVGAARAGASRLNLYVGDVRLAGRTIPALDPGEVDTRVFQVERNPDRQDIGWFDLEACADHRREVDESNESNNCAVEQFALVPRFWDVRRHRSIVETSDPTFASSGRIATRAVGMSYEYRGVFTDGDGRSAFDYRASGTVEETETRTLGSCTFEGEGSVTRDPFRNSYLRLSRRLTHHAAFVHPPGTYTGTLTCETGSSSEQDPFSDLSTWTSDGQVGWARNERASRRLFGAHHAVVSAGNTVDEVWDLRAGIP